MKRFWLLALLAGSLAVITAPVSAKMTEGDNTGSSQSDDLAQFQDDVNSGLGSLASRMSAAEDQLKLKLFGDVRLRFAFVGQSQSAKLTSATNIQATERARFRLRFGAMKQFGDFTAAFRLATGTDNNPLSENQSFTNEFSNDWIGVDQAYITYVPTFLNGHLKATAGKMPNPLTTTPISWDPDPQPEGALLEGSLDDAKLRATYFILSDSSGVVTANNQDLYMAWFQAEQNFKFDPDTSALFTVGYEYVPDVTAYQGTGSLAALAPAAPTNPTGGAYKTPTALGMVANAHGIIPDVETLEFLLNIKNKIGAVPFKWTLHFMDNLDSFTLTSKNWSNQYGGWASVTAGDASDKGAWSGMFAVGYIEPDATFSLITDDDDGDNNTEFLRGNITYGIEKGLQLSWTNWAISHVYYSLSTGAGTASNGLGKTSQDPEIESYLDLLATF
jgi:hypothetical protein